MTSYASPSFSSGGIRSLNMYQIRGLLLLAGILICAMLYKLAAEPDINPAVQLEQIQYEQEQIRLKRATLHRNDALTFYGMASFIGTINFSLLIIALAIARSKLRQASVCSARIGEHSTIPIRYHDLPQFYPIAMNLSQAEFEASVSTTHDKAYQISRQMLQDVTNVSRTLFGGRKDSGLPVLGPGHTVLPLTDSVFATPECAGLLRNGTLAPGKPIVLGYTQGLPQYRDLADLKSVAVAGWQGSGKTRSMAYLIAATVVTQDVQVYVIDPHRQHPDSLAALLHPLERTGRVAIINPFDTPMLLQQLNRTLDRRLAGDEPSTRGIVLVIDELARLAKMDYFDQLVQFLERCTEETRKANITFIGGSPKWTARHFKGRADIRGCMNSMLIHKTKPSQAELLLEDAQDKKLVKQVRHPGEAILVTDYAAPVVIAIPLCTKQDMETIAEMVGQNVTTKHTNNTKQDLAVTEGASPFVTDSATESKPEKPTTSVPSEADEQSISIQELKRQIQSSGSSFGKTAKLTRRTSSQPGSEVIPLAPHRKQILKSSELTVEILVEQITYLKQKEQGLTQASIARWAGMSPGLLSRILNGHTALNDGHKQKLYAVLFDRPRLYAVHQ